MNAQEQLARGCEDVKDKCSLCSRLPKCSGLDADTIEAARQLMQLRSIGARACQVIFNIDAQGRINLSQTFWEAKNRQRVAMAIRPAK